MRNTLYGSRIVSTGNAVVFSEQVAWANVGKYVFVDLPRNIFGEILVLQFAGSLGVFKDNRYVFLLLVCNFKFLCNLEFSFLNDKDLVGWISFSDEHVVFGAGVLLEIQAKSTQKGSGQLGEQRDVLRKVHLGIQVLFVDFVE